MKKREYKLGDSSKRVTRVVAAPIGAVIGVLIFDYIDTELELATKYGGYFVVGGHIISAIFMAVIIVLLSVPIVDVLNTISWSIADRIAQYSPKTIWGTIIGGVAGILIASALGSFFDVIPSTTVATVAKIITYLLLTFIGARLGYSQLSERLGFLDKAERTEKKAKLLADQGVKILDTSAIIDGRILDVIKTDFIGGSIIIPEFVLEELQHIADSPDMLKRNRGRRGLEIVNALKKQTNVKTSIEKIDYKDIKEVDMKLLKLANDIDGKIVTVDYNLNKVATLQDIKILNINDLANAIKPIALPGEVFEVNIIKHGKDFAQGVGFMEDGTMIVIENGGEYVGQTVKVTVTTSLQTSAGRMVFARIGNIE